MIQAVIKKSDNFTIVLNQESHDIPLDTKSIESENGMIKVYPGLNGIHQSDERLIKFLWDHVIVKPDNKPLNLVNKPNIKNLGGQYNQPFAAKRILGKVSMKQLGSKGTKRSLILMFSKACCVCL